MAAALIVLDKYLPVPTGSKSYTLKDDNAYYSIDGALSFGFFTQILSVARNYRNELPANYIGRPWINVVSGAPVVGNAQVAWGSSGNLISDGTAPTQTIDPISANDDRFTKTPPIDETVSVTFVAFMDGATGAGNCVALVPASDFAEFSPNAPTRY